jgi:Dynamin family/zinc-ribbon domain
MVDQGFSCPGGIVMTVCSNCGRQNPAGVQFCTDCGEYLHWQVGGEPAPMPVAEPAGDPPVAPVLPTPRPGASPGDEPATHPVAAPTAGLVGVLSALDEGRRLAVQQDRPDVGLHLSKVRERLAGQVLGVAVVGEFKRGKSTLVNALLQTDICPVDADIVTAVPTMIRYGSPPSAVARMERPQEPGAAPVEEPVAVDQLFTLVSEAADPDRRSRLRSVEVRLPHRLLRTGLALVDTPGVGGLDSSHGMVTLGALGEACGMMFVTDASQELTAPEVAFLSQALERCPAGICVVTKTDLYPQWRRIVELDRHHLAHAGIDIPLVAVSSFLRLRALRMPELNEESGFAPLFDWLRTDVMEAAADEAVSAAGRDLDFAQEQLRLEVVAEQQVLARPETSEHVVGELRRKSERTRRLMDGGTGWQQFLYDGIESLVADVKYDLDERIRSLNREVESVIEQGDPKQTWSDIEVWLQRQVVLAATANYDLMSKRAAQLTAEVAETFAMESDVPLELGLTAPADVLRGLALDPAPAASSSGGQQLTRMIFAGRTAALLPSLAFGMFGVGVLMVAVAGSLSLVVGAGIGRKLIRDERERQLVYRRQQAKMACRRYLDEAAFVVGKDCQDSLRRIRRELRDEFQARAAVLHASSERALVSAERAALLAPQEQKVRAEQLGERRREIDRLGRMASAGRGDG